MREFRYNYDMNFLTAVAFGLPIVYLLLVFGVSHLVLPFYGFQSTRPADSLPEEVSRKVKELEDGSKDARDFAEKVFDFVRSRWGAARMATIIHLPLAFRTDLSKLWQQPGFAHCQTINYIYISMLTHSPWFSPADVRTCYQFFNGVMHQYCQIRIDGEWLDADPSVTYLPLKLGERAKGFG